MQELTLELLRSVQPAGIEIAEKIGQGGCAGVYKLKNEASVVKVLDVELLRFRANIRRLAPLDRDQVYRELDYARRLTQLKNPHLMPVTGLYRCMVQPAGDEAREIFMLRMPLRPTLEAMGDAAYEAGKAPDENEIIRIVCDVCRALETIHQEQVEIDDRIDARGGLCVPGPLIHRDIKPDNVFVCDGSDGVRYYQLGDFGACFLSGRGWIDGQRLYNNAAYSAPESNQDEIGPASDVFSLGFMLYWWMDNWQHPVEARAARGKDGFEEKYRLKNMSRELWDVFMKATSIHSAQRYPTAAALRKALEDCVAARDNRIGMRDKGLYAGGGAAAALALTALMKLLSSDEKKRPAVTNDEIDYGNGLVYRGEVRDGKPHGRGCLYFTHGAKLDGCWKNGAPDGTGVLTLCDGRSFKGKGWRFVTDKPCRDGDRPAQYTGLLCGEVFTGVGGLICSDGYSYIGELVNGRPDGQGRYIFCDGTEIVGRWSYFEEKRHPYKGMILDGKAWGNGEYRLNDNSRYIGEFREGEISGFGRHVDKKGRVLRAGNWLNGAPVE